MSKENETEKQNTSFIDELPTEAIEHGISIDGLTEEQKANLGNDGHDTGIGEDFKQEEAKEEKKEEGKEIKDDQKSSSEDDAEKQKDGKKSDDQKDIKAELELIEKRRKDTEKAYQKEHQEKLRLEAELEELKKKKESSRKSDDVNLLDDEEILFDDDDKDKDVDKSEDSAKADELKAELDEIKKRQEALEQERILMAWETEAAKVKAEHDDFNEVVGLFEEAFEASPKLKEEFNSRGATPAVAYELGLKLKQYNDAIEGKAPSVNKEQNNSGSEKKDNSGLDPEHALGGNSAKIPSSGVNSTNDPVSVIDEALAGIT